MAIELVTKYLPYVDELFSSESKKSLLTNNDFDWTGAHTIKVYKIGTSAMNDYDRTGTGSGATGSRYGAIENLAATTQSMMVLKDRSFTFVIDKLDSDETGRALEAATALARQLREVVVPEVDARVYDVMCKGAGTKPEAVKLTAENIYTEIIKATTALDNAEVSKKRVPENFGFMVAHPCATVAPTKLADYKTHQDPPGISGQLIEGRVVYDAHVLDNKKKAIYYQENKTA